MPMLEVRCCCEPTKLLGYLPAPEGSRCGSTVRFSCSVSRSFPPFTAVAVAEEAVKFVDLPLAKYAELSAGAFVSRLAFKAEGMTVEQLRNIVGFVEEKS